MCGRSRRVDRVRVSQQGHSRQRPGGWAGRAGGPRRRERVSKERARGPGQEAGGRGLGDHGRTWAFTWGELGATGQLGASQEPMRLVLSVSVPSPGCWAEDRPPWDKQQRRARRLLTSPGQQVQCPGPRGEAGGRGGHRAGSSSGSARGACQSLSLALVAAALGLETHLFFSFAMNDLFSGL